LLHFNSFVKDTTHKVIKESVIWLSDIGQFLVDDDLVKRVFLYLKQFFPTKELRLFEFVRQFDDFQIEKLFVGDIKIKCHYFFFHTSSLERKKRSFKSVFKP
jgi:hypothetical protein